MAKDKGMGGSLEENRVLLAWILQIEMDKRKRTDRHSLGFLPIFFLMKPPL